MKGLNYPAKILIAWCECISGNEKITQWLIKNGFTELGLFRYALRNEDRSRKWLLDNGHPHLMALINGIEGNEDALNWLKAHGFELLYQMALAGDGNKEAILYLEQGDRKIFGLLAKRMEVVKDEIQAANIDYHKISNS